MTKHAPRETLADVVAAYAPNGRNQGDLDVQVAVLSTRINALTQHLQKNQRDYHSRRRLLSMVSQRNRLLTALASKDPAHAANLAARLGLRTALSNESERT